MQPPRAASGGAARAYVKQMDWESLVLHRQDGLHYLVARPEHGPAIARILARSFVHEPMSRAVGLSESTLVRILECFVPECTANGLSVIAVPEDDVHSVVGVFINHDFRADLPAGFPDRFPGFLPIADALRNINSQYERQRPGLGRGEVMCLSWGAVDPHGRFARRGIAKVLFKVSVDMARRHGFERCVAECTGHYSQQAARWAGFQPMARLRYRDHLFRGRPVFRSIEAPHAELVFLERVLN
jgi:hypothetical protein